VCFCSRAKSCTPTNEATSSFFFQSQLDEENLLVSGGRLGVDLGHLLHRIHLTFGARVVVAEDVQRHPVLLLGALDFLVELCVVQRQAAVDGERLEGFLVLL
jgi:hypothetical protein